MMSTLFAKLYDPLTRPFELTMLGNIRKELVSELKGDVLEIGSGTGANFPYYSRANKVVAVEPDPDMRESCTRKAKKARIPIILTDASAEKLPFNDNSFDVVIGTLVLCTINNPTQALEEVKRVAKPGAPILFFEHVRAEKPWIANVQDKGAPIWKKLCAGCHLNRNTLQIIKKSDIHVKHVDKRFKDIFLTIKAENCDF